MDTEQEYIDENLTLILRKYFNPYSGFDATHDIPCILRLFNKYNTVPTQFIEEILVFTKYQDRSIMKIVYKLFMDILNRDIFENYHDFYDYIYSLFENEYSFLIFIENLAYLCTKIYKNYKKKFKERITDTIYTTDNTINWRPLHRYKNRKKIQLDIYKIEDDFIKYINS